MPLDEFGLSHAGVVAAVDAKARELPP